MASVRWGIFVTVVVVAATLYGWGNALYENPVLHARELPPTALTVRVLAYAWNFTGCGLTNRTVAGGLYPAASPIALSEVVRNAGAVACTLESASVSPSIYSLTNVSTPATLPPGASIMLTVTLEAPAFAPPTVVSILVSAA